MREDVLIWFSMNTVIYVNLQNILKDLTEMRTYDLIQIKMIAFGLFMSTWIIFVTVGFYFTLFPFIQFVAKYPVFYLKAGGLQPVYSNLC